MSDNFTDGRASGSHKRSMQACLSCRSRKVRCDVSSRGQPCTNCDLDSKNCLVNRRPLKPSTRAPKSGDQISRHSPGERQLPDLPHEDSQVAAFKAARPANPVRNDPTWGGFCVLAGLDTDMSELMESPMALGIGESGTTDPGTDRNAPGAAQCSLDWPTHGDYVENPRLITALTSPEKMSTRGQATIAGDPGSSRQGRQRVSAGATVLYSHYPYLTIGNLHKIPHQDVSYLEAQGCLHVPTRPTLDRFVEQYFMHVHVLLPLLNEGDFWDMYSLNDGTPAWNTLPLLVFQAMLFASCGFVHLEVIEKLGFSCLRTARAELYRRAKLLYDLETESTPLPLAQAALLLMHWVPPSNLTLNPYNTWLSLAIQHARSINADRYAGTVEDSALRSPVKRKNRNALRRLWWCCIILDRLSPLCTRFSICITRDRFDFDKSVPLGIADLEDEIHRSSVFSAATKRCQIALFSQFLDLIILLTDVLTFVFPFQDSVMSKILSGEDDHVDIEKLDAAMKDWYLRATAQFPPYRDDSPRFPDKNHGPANSVVLHTTLLYIYYHTADIAFCHYKILRQSVASDPTKIRTDNISQAAQFHKNQCELQDSALKVTQCFGELIRRRITRWLPISGVACVAIPLALHVITARLSAISKELAFDPTTELSSMSTSNGNRLNVLVQTMKAFSPQYYGVEWIKETARYAANLAQEDSQSLSRARQVSITDWSQILAIQPVSYLRITWAVDVCISKGRLPEENDFPTWVRRLLRAQKDHPDWQGRKPQTLLANDSTILEEPLNCDFEQIMSFVPSLTDSIPVEQPLADEDSNAELPEERVDAVESMATEGWMNFDNFAHGLSAGIDPDGMDWASMERPRRT